MKYVVSLLTYVFVKIRCTECAERGGEHNRSDESIAIHAEGEHLARYVLDSEAGDGGPKRPHLARVLRHFNQSPQLAPSPRQRGY